MLRFVSAALLVIPAPALAHPGHLAEVAGHGHWVAGAAIALAAGIALWNTLRDHRRAEPEGADEAEVAEEADADPQEA